MNAPGCSQERPGFHSRKGQSFACEFLSIVAQIFTFLLHVKSCGYSNYRGITNLCRFRKMMVPLTNSLKHAAA